MFFITIYIWSWKPILAYKSVAAFSLLKNKQTDKKLKTFKLLARKESWDSLDREGSICSILHALGNEGRISRLHLKDAWNLDSLCHASMMHSVFICSLWIWDTGSAFKIAEKANSILLLPILSRPTYTFQYSGQKLGIWEWISLNWSQTETKLISKMPCSATQKRADR